MSDLSHIVVGYVFAFLIICSYCLGRFAVRHGGRKDVKRIIIILIAFFCILPIYLETMEIHYQQEGFLQYTLTAIHPFLIFILPLIMSIPSRSVLKKIAKIKRLF